MSDITARLATLQARKREIYLQRMDALLRLDYAMVARLDKETEAIEYELEILRNAQGSR